MSKKLEDGRYINLATYRRSGVAVETPVWFAKDSGRFYVFSAGNAGKVKRLRSSSRLSGKIHKRAFIAITLKE